MRTQAIQSLSLLALGLLTGCGAGGSSSSGSGGTTNGAGGSGGASVSTGGAPGAGGAMSSGGAFTNGGAPASGGSTSSGGTQAAGGLASSGGKLGGGGATASGGAQAAGGATAKGGATASGGATSTGSGGATNAGGSGGASPGCGSTNTTSPCGTKGTTCSVDINGTARTYYVQLPKNYSASTPYRLIFQFHPWGGSADQALTMYGLNSTSGIPDAIYVTPQGLDAGGNGPGWANTNGQDIAFTKAMLADVQGKYCVDNSRIFSVGFSYGGMMSFAVACEMSDVFRAIAPMSGALYSDPSCKGTGHPVAMWGSHGTSDTVVPIDNGRAARDKVLQQNHCGTQTVPIDPSPCVSYQGCDAGYPVTWCEWDGPHGIPNFGSKAIAAFFKQF